MYVFANSMYHTVLARILPSELYCMPYARWCIPCIGSSGIMLPSRMAQLYKSFHEPAVEMQYMYTVHYTCTICSLPLCVYVGSHLIYPTTTYVCIIKFITFM